jgi:hypothetical protein
MFRQANAIGHFGKDGIITKFAVAKMFVERDHGRKNGEPGHQKTQGVHKS